MECIKHKIPETIPPEFAKITLASTAFYKLVNILDQLEGEGMILIVLKIFTETVCE